MPLLRRRTILIVEDDDSLRESLSDCLEDEGYRTAAVENGREALDWLHAHDAPSLILLDLWMPVMTGEEFRRAQLQEPALADIPVVVLSAVKGGSHLAAELGIQEYIAKPIRLEKLIATVQAHC
jgi:CheY-like chemotaxis protein